MRWLRAPGSDPARAIEGIAAPPDANRAAGVGPMFHWVRCSYPVDHYWLPGESPADSPYRTLSDLALGYTRGHGCVADQDAPARRVRDRGHRRQMAQARG